jgi:hypothetical protein
MSDVVQGTKMCDYEAVFHDTCAKPKLCNACNECLKLFTCTFQLEA